MAFIIRDRKTEALAAALAEATGETRTEAIRRALQERLERVRHPRRHRSLIDAIDRIADHCSALPDIDLRSAEGILGYDEHGLPH